MKYLRLFAGFALIAITLACTNTTNNEMDSTDVDETQTEKENSRLQLKMASFIQ